MDSQDHLAVGHHTLKNPASLVNDEVTLPRAKGTAAPVVIPNYDVITLDSEGNAILLYIFFARDV